jgi:hypothetical protein
MNQLSFDIDPGMIVDNTLSRDEMNNAILWVHSICFDMLPMVVKE